MLRSAGVVSVMNLYPSYSNYLQTSLVQHFPERLRDVRELMKCKEVMWSVGWCIVCALLNCLVSITLRDPYAVMTGTSVTTSADNPSAGLRA